MKILSCNGNRPLGEEVASHLKMPLVTVSIQRFADREVFVDIQETVRGENVFVIQPTSSPTNDTLMELLITIDALKRASVQSVTAVLPYYGYGRQDRKTGPRSPISAKLVANLLATAGADRLITVDWHSGQIQGFFDIPADNLTVAPLFSEKIKNDYERNSIVVVSPDVGGLVRARIVAEHLGVDMAIIDKRRIRPGAVTAMTLMGDVAGRGCVLIDDIVDSAGTLCEAAETLAKAGALFVDAYVSHGVLSGNALEKINASSLRRLIITNTIQPSLQVLGSSKVEILSVAPLLGEVIYRVAHRQSISGLLGKVEKKRRQVT